MIIIIIILTMRALLLERLSADENNQNRKESHTVTSCVCAVKAIQRGENKTRAHWVHTHSVCVRLESMSTTTTTVQNLRWQKFLLEINFLNFYTKITGQIDFSLLIPDMQFFSQNVQYFSIFSQFFPNFVTVFSCTHTRFTHNTLHRHWTYFTFIVHPKLLTWLDFLRSPVNKFEFSIENLD